MVLAVRSHFTVSISCIQNTELGEEKRRNGEGKEQRGPTVARSLRVCGVGTWSAPKAVQEEEQYSIKLSLVFHGILSTI